jgi:dimethylamine/trimethylamine dehydrogenase
VTTYDVVSPLSDLTLEGPLLRRQLHNKGVRFHRGITLHSVTDQAVEGVDEFDDPFVVPTDGLVVVTQQLSRDAIYHELVGGREALQASGIEAVYRIGDAVSPRMISEAIFDGHRLAREIDSKTPAIPLPFDRERGRPA